ncbi:presequence protease, mitochondrial, partial [Bombina bombina]|uniref:presequence protease, mitochondrial n=1 Tax=Bombina bombina TaxID=8345 RepID=UPI00235AE1DF
MKGAFTDNEKVFSQYLQNKLLPDHTYAVVSGGEPLNIPDLTWEQLRQFHATHYHPSNARFFTYGNFPLEMHLKQIHEDALRKFERIDVNTAVPLQERWRNPRSYHATCGEDSFASDPAKQTTVSISFLLSDITDSFEAFTLSLLSSLLVSGPNSPFYKALIEAKLGTDFSPDTGFNNYTKETYFSIGLQGMAKEDIETVKDIISKTIDEVAEKGVEPERIEAILHKLEIQMKHQSTSFGLTLASYIASCWNHEGNPVDLLKIGEQMARFRQCLKDNPKFLQEKVKQYFQDNPHKMFLSMSPDELHYDKQAQMEDEKLNQIVQALTEEERKQIYEKGLELIDLQSKPQDTSCLPALKVSDIEPCILYTELEMAYTAGDVPVQYCAQPTNGMVYFRAISSLNTLPEELKPYVPLFCSVVT